MTGRKAGRGEKESREEKEEGRKETDLVCIHLLDTLENGQDTLLHLGLHGEERRRIAM